MKVFTIRKVLQRAGDPIHGAIRYGRKKVNGISKTAIQVVQASPRRVVIGVAAVILTGVFAATALVSSPEISGQAAPTEKTKAAAADHKNHLKSQVDTARGEPRDGRDPSTQKQTSLAQAASAAHGNGLRTDKPASGVRGTASHDHSSHSHGYETAQDDGINAAGCFIDYGIPGEQCLAAGTAGDDKILTCAEVRTKFADGIKVSGTDRFHLDTNGDNWACGSGE